jgi:hypothetical protein
MPAFTRAWLRFWFAPAPPGDLGLARALFFGGLLLIYAGTDFSAWGTVSPAFWMPLPFFEAMHLRPLGREGLAIVQAVWRLALLASAVGLQTRVSMWAAFLLGFYLLGLPHNFGHTFHFDATLVIAMGVLACSRAGDAWSIDAMRDKRTVGPSGEYTWPLRAVWVAMSLVFLAAGLAKLRFGGAAWVFSSNLSIVLMRAPYHVSDADPITTLGLVIARHEWLSRTLAIGTLFVELGFVSALFSRRARLVFVPAAFALLVGIRVLMGPTFGGFLLANVFWVPWSAVLKVVTAWASSRIRSSAPAATLHGRTGATTPAAPDASHTATLRVDSRSHL